MLDSCLSPSVKKRIAILVLLASPCHAHAAEQAARCPGDTTVEMIHCASISLDRSDSKVERLAGQESFKSWQKTRSQMCNKVFGNRQGSIWPQIELECNTSLNEALIKQFELKLGD